MSKGFIVGIGGGGASLNYKVVGGTEQPASPSENMIWVNTDAEITSHVFSATEPEAPAEGLVWFKTGSASNGAFNALKNDTLMVYILVVSQYTNGNWKSVVAKIWQSGKWGQFVTYVFKNFSTGTVILVIIG